MTKREVKTFFGSLSKLAELCSIEPQAVSQWFSKGRDGEFIADKVRRNAVIGAARLVNKDVPKDWYE